ncbi:MAG TPA: nitroreductase family protein [Aldersonia sp.]
MNRQMPDEATVEAAIALATRAPSIHNTQPWHFKVDDFGVHLYADSTLRLPATDPDGRDQLLSCGAALHHLQVAFGSLGWECDVHRMPRLYHHDHLATIELSPHIPTPEQIDLARAITRRRSDRRQYDSKPVPPGLVQELLDRADDLGVTARELPEGDPRARLSEAIRAVGLVHANNAEFQSELHAWTGGRGTADGVPAANAIRSAPDAEFPNRAFANAAFDQPAGPDAATVIALGTARDDPEARLRAGEATSAVLLAATRLGMATCPLTEPLEIADIRAELGRELLGARFSQQILIRVGWPDPGAGELPQTPRRPVDEVLDHR